MIKKIYKQSLVVLIIFAALSAFFEWKKLPLSILLGGVLGLANLKALSWGVEGMIGTYKASGKLIFFSMLRLFLIFALLGVLLALHLINILGVLVGFTVVFIILMKEGFLYSRDDR